MLYICVCVWGGGGCNICKLAYPVTKHTLCVISVFKKTFKQLYQWYYWRHKNTQETAQEKIETADADTYRSIEI